MLARLAKIGSDEDYSLLRHSLVTPSRYSKALKKVANAEPRTEAECHAAMI